MKKLLMAAAVCSMALALPRMGAAQAAQKVRVDIPAQALSAALTQFGRETGTEIVFAPAAVREKKAGAIKGEYERGQALKLLLEGSGLTYRITAQGAIVVEPLQTSAAAAGVADLRLAQGEDQVQAPPGNLQTAEGSVAEDAAGNTREIVVTGTHIKGVSNSTAPVITLDREAIERTGYSTTEDLFESLPQNFGGGQAGASADGIFGNGAFRLLNYSAGTGVNLRGIGASSTLVLINGHRMAPTGFGTFVDISAIPLSAVERVEILTDGSSAIYGSDAVAGVVNILLRKDYAGAEASARYGSASGGTREEKTLAGSFGTRWSGGGGIVSVQHQDMGVLLTRERSFARSALQPSTLLPETVNTSALINVGQDLGGRARLGMDVMYARRDVWAQEAGSFAPFVDTSEVEQQDINIAPTLQVALSDRWSLDISPLFARQRMDKYLVRIYQGGLTDTSRDESSFELSSVDVLTGFGLVRLPAGEVSVAAGAAYRDEQLDDTFQGLNGFDGGLAMGRNVTSAFAEFHVPLVGPGRATRGVAGLELSAAVRWDSYSDFGDTTNPRVGLLWTVGETLSIRGSYSHSFRAPTVMELNSAAQGTAGVVAYDFANPSGEGSVPALFTSGSRLDLAPERAKTTSVGLDFSPDFIPGLTFGATYYRINYTDRILTPPFDPNALRRQDIYGGLITTFASDAEAQTFVDAAVAAGGSYFDATVGQTGIAGVRYAYDFRQQNASRLRQNGFDLTAAYRIQLGAAALSLRANATNVQHILATYRGAVQDVDQVATYGNPPESRLRFDVGLDTRLWSLNAGVNSYDDYLNTLLPVSEPVDSWLTVDFSARLDIGAWSAAPAADGLTLQLSGQNLFDEDPPFVYLGRVNSVRYDSANANPLGRFLALQLRKQW